MYFNKLRNCRTNPNEELGFVKSEDQKELLKPIMKNWSISGEELKTLYLNNYITLKNSSVKFVIFPSSFWLTGIFSFLQLVIFTVFLLAYFSSDSEALVSHAIGASSTCLIIMVFYVIFQNMIKPVNTLVKKYHFWG